MKTILFILTFSLINTIVYAQPANNNCASAIALTVDAPCTNGTNVGATTQIGEPTAAGCLASAMNGTVWYTFTTGLAGVYNISTDNGGTTDTQLKLYSGACPGVAVNEVGCNEDGGSSNTLAAFISATLAASTTYLIQADVYAASTGTFCISVQFSQPPTNDCIFDAVDITSQINGITSTNLFDCSTYTYNAIGTGGEPTADVLAGDPNGCNGSVITIGIPPGQTPNTDHRDIWFKFTVDGSTPPAWLSVYQQTGTSPNYSTALYSGTPAGTCGSGGSITGMTQIDCSAGEYVDAVLPGSNIDGGSLDMAECTTPIHPRLDVSNLPNGTYYFRVWESFGGAPSDGIINLCAESGVTSGATSDGCPTQNTLGCDDNVPNSNVNVLYSNLANNACLGNACNTAPNEPQLAVGAAGDIRENCSGPWVTQVGYANNVMNNSAIYQFTVNSSVPCTANILLDFRNIDFGGTIGNSAQIQVMNGTCVGGTSAVMTGTTASSCLQMRPSGGTLPNGTYYIVVDGQDGQLVGYDLNLAVNYSGVGCTSVNCGSVILGVNFEGFNVVRTEENEVQIFWETINEVDNDFFIVQRTYDGEKFEDISIVDAAGNTTDNVSKYKVADVNVRPEKEFVYYRIKQVDLNGEYSYSDIKALKLVQEKHLLTRINLLGQDVDENYEGIVIEKYSNGTAKRFYQAKH